MAKIIRFCVMEEEHYGENVFLCHRPFVFGNPYIVDKTSRFKGLVKCESLEECLNLYSLYFDKSIKENPDFAKEWEKLIEAYNTFDEIYLGCYCRLDKPCHTDIIAQKLQQHITKEIIQNYYKQKMKK